MKMNGREVVFVDVVRFYDCGKGSEEGREMRAVRARRLLNLRRRGVVCKFERW